MSGPREFLWETWTHNAFPECSLSVESTPRCPLALSVRQKRNKSQSRAVRACQMYSPFFCVQSTDNFGQPPQDASLRLGLCDGGGRHKTRILDDWRRLCDARVPENLAVIAVSVQAKVLFGRTYSSDFFRGFSGGSYDADWRNDHGKVDVCASGVDPVVEW